MTLPDQTESDLTLDELKQLHDRLPPDEEAEAIEAAVDYMTSLTPGQRLVRNDAASRVTRRLDAVAKRHGLRAAAWYICGPAAS